MLALSNAKFAPISIVASWLGVSFACTAMPAVAIAYSHFHAKAGPGIASIYTKASPDIFVLLRRIEIQSEAFLFYLYNPF